MSVTNWVFYHRQGEPGLPGDPGDPGDLGLKVNTNIHTLQGLPFNINTGVWNLNYKLLFEENVTIVFDLIKWRAVKMSFCCVVLKCDTSSCRQGDVGMEGPRGGVGGPGETVRKHNAASHTSESTTTRNNTLLPVLSVCLLKSHMINGNTSPSLHHWSLHAASLSLYLDNTCRCQRALKEASFFSSSSDRRCITSSYSEVEGEVVPITRLLFRLINFLLCPCWLKNI